MRGVIEAARGGKGDYGGAVDSDGVVLGEVSTDRIGIGSARKRCTGANMRGRNQLAVLHRTVLGTVDVRLRGRADDQRVGGEVADVEEFGARHGGVVLGGERIAREVGAIGHRRRRLRGQEVVAELQHRRHAAGDVAGGRVDRDAFEVVARAVDEVAVLVEREVTAASVTINAVEHRVVVGEAAGLLYGEEAVAVDRHVGRDRGGLHVALHRVGFARARADAAGELRVRTRVRDQVEEARVDALEGGGLRVSDVAGDVLQGIGLRAQACDGGGESAENTHYYRLQLRNPGGQPGAEKSRIRRRSRKPRAKEKSEAW